MRLSTLVCTLAIDYGKFAKVGARDVVRFQISLAALFKTNMAGLKKKERKTKKKST